ncbi:hypothetical protein J2S43_002621 [Catenuloplanes nepalensis]|uniref:Uncharacterized protein n=1 Tax=Catenuloplanes nepalensis TaxID=587533 RepID=A0ABT9MRQ0_9ACTN|nr:hypothetical protein [Catenuloplanes nepalensis]MDP9794109.1 hypothetical protein [Catenuloplanes nepalensis]
MTFVIRFGGATMPGTSRPVSGVWGGVAGFADVEFAAGRRSLTELADLVEHLLTMSR